MIQANELRVGILLKREIHYQGGRSDFEVITITEEIMGKIFSGSLEYTLNDLFGLPITQHGLVSLGLKKLPRLKFERRNFIVVFMSDGTKYFGTQHENLLKVEYLHEVQNLYYDLLRDVLIAKG